MSNIATLLKVEISRISRREIRKEAQPLRKASAAYRREIAALKREVQGLRRQTTLLSKQVAKPVNVAVANDSTPSMRFVAKGLRSLRARLDLSASQLARLIGVSEQSIYNWELKKTTPRKEQLVALSNLRSVGKREVHARLEEIDAPRKKNAARKAR